jgi:hypothetical protein
MLVGQVMQVEEFQIENSGVKFAPVTLMTEMHQAVSLTSSMPKVQSCLLSYSYCATSVMHTSTGQGGRGRPDSEFNGICKKIVQVQFNLELSDKEREDRSKVVLPFEHQGVRVGAADLR